MDWVESHDDTQQPSRVVIPDILQYLEGFPSQIERLIYLLQILLHICAKRLYCEDHVRNVYIERREKALEDGPV